MSRKRVGVLISGRGSNMSALIEASKAPDYPAEIVGVHDSGVTDETLLATWLARVPRGMLTANLGVDEQMVTGFPPAARTFSRPGTNRP